MLCSECLLLGVEEKSENSLKEVFFSLIKALLNTFVEMQGD